MKPVALSQIATWCGARLLGADCEISAVSSDTRSMLPGSLFVALRGENFDAHSFVSQAQNNGAAALLVSRPVESALPQILCADTQEALGEFAAGMQQARSTAVLALTGSNGKTSIKMLTQGILSRVAATYINPGNRNNEIGLPLAVIDAPEEAVFGVYEMGAGKPGDIAYLASIAPPRVALVNNIAPAHLERMGSLLGVAETKAAIYEALSDDGTAVVNVDDAFAPYFLQRIGMRQVFRFGVDNDADIRASAIVLDRRSCKFKLHTPAGSADITLPLPGRHNVMNALAATGLALAAGASLDAVVAGLQHAESVPGRQIAHVLSSGAVLVDDSYNANPGSVAAAIATLTQDGDAAWLVLGDMAELGEGTEALHADIGIQAKRAGVVKLWSVGRLTQATQLAFGAGGKHFANKSELISALLAELHAPVRCLVKGSHSSAMNEVVQAVLKYDKENANHAA